VRYGWLEISEVRARAGPSGVEGWKQSLARNLATIVATAKAAGVGVVFLTYPSSRDFYAATDEVIRQAAAETGTPLVDVAAHFASLCPGGNCPTLLFEDQHPTAEGTTIAANLLAEWLATAEPDR